MRKEKDNHVVVRRIGAHTSAAIHAVLFDDQPGYRTLAELKAGIVSLIRKRHARD